MSKKGVIFLSFGVGMLLGSGLTCLWMCNQLKLKLQQLCHQIDALQKQLILLRELVGKEQGKYNVANENNLEDDDIFEEAFDKPFPWFSSFCPTALNNSENGNRLDNFSDGTDSTLFEEVDKLFDGNDSDQRRAHELLELKSRDLMENVDFVWRLCKSTFLLSQSFGPVNKDKQKHMIYEALQLATLALELDNSSSNAHKWYAITLGSSNDFEGANAKIQNGHKFKVHIEKAITLNPCDPSSHYLLGRWCYGVYMLSWIERKIAATLFSSPPQATIDESLSHFLKANELNPGKWKENMLFIAKCYVEKKDITEAVKWLKEAWNLPVVTNDDTKNQSEIKMYLERLS